MDVINGYGCWRYFNDDHGKGKSKPVNEIDAYCKTLHEGYECAILDGIEEGSSCEPWNSAYTTGAKGDIDGIIADCGDRNVGDNCAIRSCIVEGWFVTNIFQAFFGGHNLDQSIRHQNGFDVAGVCTVN